MKLPITLEASLSATNFGLSSSPWSVEKRTKGQLGNPILSLGFVPLLLRRICKREAIGVTALSGLLKKMQFH